MLTALAPLAIMGVPCVLAPAWAAWALRHVRAEADARSAAREAGERLRP